MKSVKKSYDPVIWGIGAIALGVLLILWSNEALRWFVIILGIISMTMGLLQFLGYLVKSKGDQKKWINLPILPILVFAFGLMLVVRPDFWQEFLLIALAVFIVLMGIIQIVSLFKLKKVGSKVPFFYFLIPIIIIIAGAVVFIKPDEMASYLMIFSGVTLIVNGLWALFSKFSITVKRNPLSDKS